MKYICPKISDCGLDSYDCSHAIPHDHVDHPNYGCASNCGLLGWVDCIPIKGEPMEPKKRKSPTTFYRCNAAVDGRCPEEKATTEAGNLCASWSPHIKGQFGNGACDTMPCANKLSPMYHSHVFCVKAAKRPRPERKQLLACCLSVFCEKVDCPHIFPHKKASTCGNICPHAPYDKSAICKPITA